MTSSVEERLSRLEGSYEQISERLNDLNQIVQGVDRKVDALRSDMDTRFDSLRSSMDARFDSLRSDMDSRFREMDSKIDKLDSRVITFGTAIVGTVAAGLLVMIIAVITVAS